MRTLFLSAANLKYDGRTRELLKVLTAITDGNIDYISTTETGPTEYLGNHYLVNHRSLKDYLSYVFHAVKFGLKSGELDLLFIDNRKASVPGIIIDILKRPKKLVYDARELYISSEVNHLAGKLGCFFEKLIIRRSDIVIAANQERKQIMESYYKKHGKIIVFENFRKLEYTEEHNPEELGEKYSSYFSGEEFYILSTAGCDLSRGVMDLLTASTQLNFPHKIFLVGCSQGEDRKKVEEFVNKNSIENIVLIPKVSQDDLLYLTENVDLGIAQYHKENSNNLYCSSGKVYEFLYGGIPIATTDNPPLARLTESLQVGASCENIGDAIQKVYDNYSYYLENVERFKNEDHLEENNRTFAEELVYYLK